ncbi:hypothetical protein BJ970_006511 [Saccharopolyspora phatthalungensis]|uniref:Uncharacterized protein n=1 Tax=Saccharopolyspora phatthalungensis TaxID=664693 RepID=A0A840Q8Q5_9PSEU|nr:hypothetical protein [Saccharopolyspora phatthalungensis]
MRAWTSRDGSALRTGRVWRRAHGADVVVSDLADLLAENR